MGSRIGRNDWPAAVEGLTRRVAEVVWAAGFFRLAGVSFR